MQPSIPASDIVNILPAALSAGGTSLSLNTVVFSTLAMFPVKEYFDVDSVGDDHGVGESVLELYKSDDAIVYQSDKLGAYTLAYKRSASDFD